ncbi:MAG: serine/threonine-protein kinase, partial [Myxococcota bacterium]
VVKVLRQSRVNMGVVERFLREARLASQLDHPYAAHIYAFGHDSGCEVFWIAMELIRGVELKSLAGQRESLPLPAFVGLFERICEVVHTAHEMGIIHRDLKPSNIMVIRRAGRLLPKLLDFGVAKLQATIQGSDDDARIDSEDELEITPSPIDTLGPIDTYSLTDSRSRGRNRTLDNMQSTRQSTREGVVVGTPPYMPPEQWSRSAEVDALSDIYALGVTAYEVLSGRRPFRGKTARDLRKAHRYSAVPMLGSGLPEELDGVLARSMAKRPDDRFPTALDLASSLARAAGVKARSGFRLPQQSAAIRANWVARAPQPLAETIAALSSSQDEYQARQNVFLAVRATAQYVGLTALAIGLHSTAGELHKSEGVLDALRGLKRESLTPSGWLELARELCRSALRHSAPFPLPELRALFFTEDGVEQRLPSGAARLVEQASAPHRQVGQAAVAHLLADLAEFLQALPFVLHYPLVVER